MLLRLVRPVKRPGSSIPQFNQRIPVDVRPRAVGRTIHVPIGEESVPVTITARMAAVRLSLRTRDPSEAKVRQARAAAAVERAWQALRAATPTTLSYRQATALAGDLYRAWAEGEGRERTTAVIHTPQGFVPDTLSLTEEEAAFGAAVVRLDDFASSGEPSDLEPALGPLVDRLLLSRGIHSVDGETRPRLLQAFHQALRDALEHRRRNAGGDYSPDPKAGRFPEWQAPVEASNTPPPKGKATLTGLVEDWWREAKAAGRKSSTYESYRNTVAKLVGFLGYDDLSRVAPQDVVRFKDHRLVEVNAKTGKPVSPKTVKDSDLAALKTLFGWAVMNHRLKSNPAAGITLKIGKTRRLRSKGFTDEEALAILRAASAHVGGPQERPWTTAAKRWVPWLCAYTGARVGEMVQLRKQDVRREGELSVLRITPEAGTVKTDEAREVVLHPHLIEMGFAEFVRRSPGGHLFLRPAKDGDVLGPLQGIKNRLAEFAREIVSDPNVMPNHGWRHRFKTVAMEVGMDPRVRDAIQGHAPRTAGDDYGDVTLRTIGAAVGRLPRFEV